MGLAYTVDSPVKVARFGITSVVSIIEDHLIEMMRSHYYPTINLPYHPISVKVEDYRARRITDYLNLLNRIVQIQVEKLRNAAFEAGSEIVKYFEMLPEESRIKQLYLQMLSITEKEKREPVEAFLRTQIVPGCIDVNIMTKTDRNNFTKAGELIADGSDAVASLRGYAQSDLSNSAVIFSAGMNPRLYNYLESCKGFEADENGNFKKRIIIKVSDYRSALIQSKYLAKKGIWVSEFRVESGLNCGGHAFATDGYLLGPILEEFKSKKSELADTVFTLYKDALTKKGSHVPEHPPVTRLSVQGGIGTAEEDQFLRSHYGVDSTGWGTPFLLVPEATTVDEATMKVLCKAEEEDLELSHNSPLGVRFHYLKGTSSHKEKLGRIESGKPGSPCTEKHLAFNTEFTEQPICTASAKYQKLKISDLQKQELPEQEYQKQLSKVLDKECLCIGLSNSAAINYDKKFIKNLGSVTICPGPNIANFSKIVSLHTMADHIYGRTNIIAKNNRPHMFIAELDLYMAYLKEEMQNESFFDVKKKKFYEGFCNNLLNGISYYKGIARLIFPSQKIFTNSLEETEIKLRSILISLDQQGLIN
jgi:hypothetical protein